MDFEIKSSKKGFSVSKSSLTTDTIKGKPIIGAVGVNKSKNQERFMRGVKDEQFDVTSK